jgi:hypothetical protein
MSFLRHGQIYRSDVGFNTRSGATCGSAPDLIVSMSLRPAIPWRVALLQSSPPLHWPVSVFHLPAGTVNHHPAGAGELSIGDLGSFQLALTPADSIYRHSPCLIMASAAPMRAGHLARRNFRGKISQVSLGDQRVSYFPNSSQILPPE